MKRLFGKPALGLILLAALWLGAVLCVRADFSPGGDSLRYKGAGECFAQSGLACAYNREPLYPLFLAVLLKLNLNLAVFVPIFQNILFLIATLFFVRTAFGSDGRLERSLQISLYTALVPTFLITMNGAPYTESLTGSLILLQMALLLRTVRASEEKWSLWVRPTMWVGIAAISGGLALIKGSFPVIQYLFAFLLISGSILLYFRGERRVLQWQQLIPLVLSLALGGPLATGAWFAVRSATPGSLFFRSGEILYGRTEYAKRFNWRQDFIPFTAEAISEKGCELIFAQECQQYGFDAENDIGISAFLQGATDGELFEMARTNILSQPLLQLAFVPMEDMRFLLHHGTTGFAQLEIPVLGALVHSPAFNLILKALNLLLYFYLVSQIWRGKLHARLAAGVLATYGFAYLSAYGFVSTVVRMIYPIAPFMVLLALDQILPGAGISTAHSQANSDPGPAAQSDLA